jgi:hypothetical protein
MGGRSEFDKYIAFANASLQAKIPTATFRITGEHLHFAYRNNNGTLSLSFQFSAIAGKYSFPSGEINIIAPAKGSPYVSKALYCADKGNCEQWGQEEDNKAQDQLNNNKPTIKMIVITKEQAEQIRKSFIDNKISTQLRMADLWDVTTNDKGTQVYSLRSVVNEYDIKIEPANDVPLVKLYHITNAKKFYIDWVHPDSTGSRYYGPFDGDPFEQLGLTKTKPEVKTDLPADNQSSDLLPKGPYTTSDDKAKTKKSEPQEIALQFMQAVKDNKPDEMLKLAAEDRRDYFAKTGIRGMEELRKAYAKDLDLLTTGTETIDGRDDLFAVRIASPKNAPEKSLGLVLRKNNDGWRMVHIDDFPATMSLQDFLNDSKKKLAVVAPETKAEKLEK